MAKVKFSVRLKRLGAVCGRLIIRYAGYIDSLILFFVVNRMTEDKEAAYMLFYIIPGFLLFINIRFSFRIFKSRLIIKNMARNNRVQGFEGGQGRGKTSLMLYEASVLKRPVYSNIPFKIKGNFTYILGTDLIGLDTRVLEKSVLIFDEISLYYNNLMQSKKTEDKQYIYSFELLLQLCRHFFDGNVFTASVNMGRIPTALEEKYSIFKRVLGQRTQYNSFIIAPLVAMFCNFALRKKISIGIRKWTYQTFENIEHESYYFDLSSNKESQKEQYYANLISCYAYNNALDFDYNDRFMKFLYEKVAKADPKAFESLDFDFNSLKDTGFNKIIEHFEKSYKE